ncbi:MAG TPA: M55 family metallopeptidase [bacterium]|uniref:D-aminopeptidase n=1 Tax=candidate division TA06 bacterium ADurb.Bin417 TaxID=1852828 RepID=A0A1V5MEQ6_UNCT6|nr:MAG: D-aminopeptidase [candidate division TA06 bacterium ADurb.Bin417]HNQ34923.1 M55 family metallopeptidase [bacterium]HNS48171.1 M55 family metallopeptidase [bacterium]
MKFFILTDLEGTAGVTTWAQVLGENKEKHLQAQNWLTGEVNAAIEGILAVDADADIVVWDGHGNGGIILDQLRPEARFIPRGFIRCPYGLDQGYDAMLMVAQHAKAGTPKANLCHTYSLSIYRYWLNGEEVGEMGLRSYIAGYHKVPVILATGDDAACREAAGLIPGIETVQVKEALHQELAVTLQPARARQLIKAGAERAVRRIKEIKPVYPKPPYRFRVQGLNSTFAEQTLFNHSGFRRVDSCTIETESDDLQKAVEVFA